MADFSLRKLGFKHRFDYFLAFDVSKILDPLESILLPPKAPWASNVVDFGAT